MQRLFSMFPQGAPGIALLLLRLSLAAIFSASLVNRLGAPASHFLLPVVLVISALNAIGFLAPVASILTCASAIATLAIHPRSDSLILISIISNSVALALLGPGAYSLDARLFGRKVMVIPRTSRRP